MKYTIDDSNQLYYNEGKRQIYVNNTPLDDISDEVLESISVPVEIIDIILKKLMKSVIKICIIGEDDLGSFYLNHCELDGFNENYWQTVGCQFFAKTKKINKKTFVSQLWNINISDRFKTISYYYLKGASICVLIFKLETQQSYDVLEFYIQKFLEAIQSPDSKYQLILAIKKGSKYDIQELKETYDIFKIIELTDADNVFLEKFLNDFQTNALDEIYASLGGVNNEIHINNLVELKNFKIKLSKALSSYFST